MTRSEKFLCMLYAFLAVFALIATWSNNLAFLSMPQNRNIWSWYHALYANHAVASITNDLFLLAIVVCIFIIIEGRRLQMRYIWWYVLLSGPSAISFTFPLFLIARQIKIAQLRQVEKSKL